jgi:hypothetical protein
MAYANAIGMTSAALETRHDSPPSKTAERESH